MRSDYLQLDLDSLTFERFPRNALFHQLWHCGLYLASHRDSDGDGHGVRVSDSDGDGHGVRVSDGAAIQVSQNVAILVPQSRKTFREAHDISQSLATH